MPEQRQDRRHKPPALSRRLRDAGSTPPPEVDLALPPDIGLMIRAHAELRCLSREVMPVLRQLESRQGLPEEQVGAAFAYLEVTWMEARRRALDTDAAHSALAAVDDAHLAPAADDVSLALAAVDDSHLAIAVADGGPPAEKPEFACHGDSGALSACACRFRTAVVVLRRSISLRVSRLLDGSLIDARAANGLLR